MEKTIIIVVGIFTLIFSLLVKSPFIFITYLVVVGAILLLKRIDNPRGITIKRKNKTTIKEDVNNVPKICDLVVFNNQAEIMDVLNNNEFEGDFKVTITNVKTSFRLDSDYLGKFNNGCFILSFNDTALFSNINKIIKSRLDTYLITGIGSDAKLRLDNNISFDTATLYVNDICINKLENQISLFDEGKFVAHLDKLEFNRFKEHYSRKYSTFFPTSFDSYMDKLEDNVELREIIEDAYYYQRNLEKQFIIVNKINNKFYSCLVDSGYIAEEELLCGIKELLILTDFTSEYVDSLGNTIKIMVK